MLVVLTDQAVEQTRSTLEQPVPGGSSSEADAVSSDICTRELEQEGRQ
jgi:hypothetical protein